jgi:DNA (cytosine-5)-methyltransferase 1
MIADALTQMNLFNTEQLPSLIPWERFEVDHRERHITRIVKTRSDGEVTSSIPLQSDVPEEEFQDLSRLYDYAWLRSTSQPAFRSDDGQELRIVDLFSGCGGLSLGVLEATRALGLAPNFVFALDTNADACETYQRNFPGAITLQDDISQILNGELDSTPTESERELLDRFPKIHMLVGGPPCQGHSDLNNHTRRADPRNQLVLRMVRFAQLFEPEYIIIENVQGIRHDKNRVMGIVDQQLSKMGYRTSQGLLLASELGVPQRRRRFFYVASKHSAPNLDALKKAYSCRERSFDWACRDLGRIQSSLAFDSSALHSGTNRRRISYLFEHDLYELPDEERPDCHRLKSHAYNSVYGRLRPDEAAPTITTGFGSTGQGRFVHPHFRRTITPHEAARLQFFPDFFRFPSQKRRVLQMLIGNAVPSKLPFLIALDLLRNAPR